MSLSTVVDNMVRHVFDRIILILLLSSSTIRSWIISDENGIGSKFGAAVCEAQYQTS